MKDWNQVIWNDVIKLTNQPAEDWDKAFMWITLGLNGGAKVDYCPVQGYKRQSDIYCKYFENEDDAHSHAWDAGFRTPAEGHCESNEIADQIAELCKSPYPRGYPHPQYKGHTTFKESYEE